MDDGDDHDHDHHDNDAMKTVMIKLILVLAALAILVQTMKGTLLTMMLMIFMKANNSHQNFEQMFCRNPDRQSADALPSFPLAQRPGWFLPISDIIGYSWLIRSQDLKLLNNKKSYLHRDQVDCWLKLTISTTEC